MRPSPETKNHILQLLPTDGQRGCYEFLYNHGPSKITDIAENVFPESDVGPKPLLSRMQMASAHLTLLEKKGLVEKRRIGFETKRPLTEWEIKFVLAGQIDEKKIGKKPRNRIPKKKRADTNQLIADLIHHIDEIVHNADRNRAAYPKSSFFNSWIVRAKYLGGKCRQYERARFDKLMEKQNGC